MDVRCERCRAQYVFDDEQVTSSGVTVQCTNCGHLFKVRKKELVVTVPVRPDQLVGTPLPATAAAPRPRERTALLPAAAPRTTPPPTNLPRWSPSGAPTPEEVSVEVDVEDRDGAPRTGAGRRLVAGTALGLAALFAAGAAVYRFHQEPLVTRGPEPVDVPVRLEATLAAPAPVPKAVPAPAPLPEPGVPAAPLPAEAAPALAVAEPAIVAQTEPEPAPEPAAARAPRGPKALLAEALRLRARGQHERALDLFGRVVEVEPANTAALAGRGLCYLELERYAPAEASFHAALEHDPEHGDALLGLAETYRWQGRRKDAIKYYESYLAAHPDGEDAVAARNAVVQLEE
jgi:predicted Zn finger-like uncharacterized protein